MDAHETKKKVKKIIKEKSQFLDFPEFEINISSDRCRVYKDKAEIGVLQLAYVTSTASGYGSLFGVYAQCVVSGGQIASIIDEIKLSYAPFGNMDVYFAAGSLSEKGKYFGERGGIIPFYEKDDLEEKCLKIVQKLNTIYVPKFKNYALGKIEVIDNILEAPTDYAYPMASIIAACYLNDKKELVGNIIGKAKRLYDSGNERVDEIVRKADRYFGRV